MKSKAILDSGAYSAFTKGTVIDIDKYAEYITEHASVYQGGYFNLDVITSTADKDQDKRRLTSKQSYENWKYLKSKGVDTIPIYHNGEDEIWLKKYLKQTDYVGLGAIASLATAQRRFGLDRIWKNYFLDSNGNPTVKVHGLGLTAPGLILAYPWYSVDSVTPLISSAFGSIFLPKVRAIEGEITFDWTKGILSKVSDQAKHTKGAGNNWPNLPTMLKEQYLELFAKNGYDLGQVDYKEKREVRKKSARAKVQNVPKLFTLDKVTGERSANTLADDWTTRLHWNLFAWNELIKQLPAYNGHRCILYVGVSSATHLKMMAQCTPRHDVLLSYAFMNDSLHKQLSEYVK
jgi:hypothetical protein